MKDRVVAVRYAQALFQAAKAAKVEEPVRQALRRFSQLLRTDEILNRVLRHPLLPPSEKKKRAAAALGKASVPVFDRFLETVLEKKRLSLLPHIAGLFDEIVDESNHIRKVQVKSAVPLSKDQVRDLETRLSRVWDQTVAVEPSVDESILGGLVLRVGDRVWDHSLRGQLQSLKEKLLESAKI